MPLVRLSGVAFSYADPVDVVTGISLDLHPGWTGVVGDNGGGKTTLLRLVAGDLAPTRGAVALDPPGATVHLCRQRTGALVSGIRTFGDSWSKREARLKARLGLDPDQLDRWSTLSPGERKRWQIGAALAAAPDVLLLDEPTNHLDADARALLAGALAGFRGVGLVVSHDRALLEALTTRTVRVHRGRVSGHAGAYGAARDAWLADERQLRERHAAARRDQRALTRRLADKRRAHAGAQAAKSSRKRMKSVRDSDARGALAKGRAAAGEARVGRDVSVLRRAVARAEERVARIASGADAGGAGGAGQPRVPIGRERGRAVFVDYEPAPVRWLAAIEGDDLVRGGVAVLREVRVALARDARVHVRGANGAGKTTLLEALRAGSRVPPERLLYLPQSLEDEAGAGRALLDDLRAAPPDRRGRALQIAAAFGLDPDRVLATADPSPGELRKLYIARGLGAGAWAVILDEPTNHLDLPSIERLEAALRDYPGALLVVSHDHAFAAAVTDEAWLVADGRVSPAPTGGLNRRETDAPPRPRAAPRRARRRS